MNKTEFVKATTNEDVIDSWLTVVPDGADDEDFKLIGADDELFGSAVSLFIKLSKHIRGGLYLNDRWYT